MTITVDADRARDWVRRWDAQQELYVADREERFAVIADVVADALDRTGGRGTVLDLGCGPGSLSARLADRLPGAHITGVDADPLLLALGTARYGDRITFLDADLADLTGPVWTTMPSAVDAVVSTTALHWLAPDDLAALYRDLGRRVRPGGVFVNGDHLTTGDPALDALAVLVRHGRAARAGATEREDWQQWWAGVTADPALAELVTERSTRSVAHHGSNSLSVTEHADLLRAAGFRSAGTVWQSGDDHVLVAVR